MSEAPPISEPAALVLETELDRLRHQLLRARLADATIAGAILAMLLLALNAAIGSPTAPLLLLIASVSLTAALVLLRRPTRLQTATRIDSTHRLNELLSSALLTAERTDDWCHVIRTQAEQTLRTLPPIAFRLFGARAHAGVWLLATAVTVAALVGRAATHTGDSADSPSGRAGGAAANATSTLATTGGIRAREAQSEVRGQNTESATDAAGSVQRPRTTGGDDARGSGRADAADSATAAPRAITDAANPARSAGRIPGTGDGRQADDISATGTAAAAARVAAANRSAAAPWNSDSWSSRRDAAQAAVEAGRIPEAYRDLVRDYFDR